MEEVEKRVGRRWLWIRGSTEGVRAKVKARVKASRNRHPSRSKPVKYDTSVRCNNYGYNGRDRAAFVLCLSLLYNLASFQLSFLGINHLNAEKQLPRMNQPFLFLHQASSLNDIRIRDTENSREILVGREQSLGNFIAEFVEHFERDRLRDRVEEALVGNFPVGRKERSHVFGFLFFV